MGCYENLALCLHVFVGLVMVLHAPFSSGLTDPRDVAAINGLYISLEFPPLKGWLLVGGDPCGDGWQGVNCVFSNITSIELQSANLRGQLDDSIGLFASIIAIDMSNNHIGGSIPSSLPPTLTNLYLSDNQFSGRIPETLASLTQLLDLTLNNNLLSGGIPDAFERFTGLTNLDLSANNLSGQLPPSWGNLPALHTLHLQNNKLTGTLDVLQDLPLKDLNVENNLFSGPIPDKLRNIPNFRKDGNPFNTTILPPPPASLPPSTAEPPSSAKAPWKQSSGPSASETPKYAGAGKFFTTKRVIWIASIGGVVVIVLGVCLSLSTCCKRRQKNKDVERHDMGSYKSPAEEPDYSKSSVRLSDQMEKAPKKEAVKSQDKYELDKRRMGIIQRPEDEQRIDVKTVAACSRKKNNDGIDKTSTDSNLMLQQPPHPHPPFLPVDKVIANPIGTAERITRSRYTKNLTSSCSARVFTIASLQQYTTSFSEEKYIGEGMLGSVYIAELPDGKQVAVKKLKPTTIRRQSDKEFLELVSCISKFQHANVVELVGYCNEHAEQLLVYNYIENGSLHDALHVDDEIHEKLSWNARIWMALGAARALQYLHEVCQPPIVHGNFKSANILLDDKLAVLVSDCGLASLISSGSASQFSGHLLTSSGYAGPEIESGIYNCKSDIYSFGVVLLELLTGRKAFDRSRSRAEQSLVRWAIPQLHDIDALSKMVDPYLNGAYPIKSLSRFADIISRCVQWDPEFRPPMSEVVQDLLRMT